MDATCLQCSKEIQPGSKFCPYCGKESPTDRTEKKCVECSQVLLADAAFCPDCGRDQRAAQQTEVLDLSCRKCRSDNVKKLPIAYAEGLSMVNLTTTGAGVGVGGGGIGLGVGAASTNGTTQTLWSDKMAPPELNSNTEVFGVIAIGLILIALCLCVTTSFLAGAVMGAVAPFFWRLSNRAYAENQKTRLEIAKWEASYVCLRCGEIFVDEKEHAGNRETARLLALAESGDEIYRTAHQD